MFTLTLDRSKYLRLRAGVTRREAEREFLCPVSDDVRGGEIVRIPPMPMRVYVADVGDDYASVAQKLGVEEERLLKINGAQPVYPTRKLYY